MEAVEADITAATAKARGSVTDPVKGLRRAFNAFLDLACETEVRQIVLMDAHSVLGWKRWREIEERYGLGRLKLAMKAIAATGRIPEDMVDTFAHLLLASLIEIAFLVARSPEPQAAAKLGRKAIKELLARLLSGDAEST